MQDQNIYFSNQRTSVIFDRCSGALVDVKDKQTGASCLAHAAKRQLPFDVYEDFHSEFSFRPEAENTVPGIYPASGEELARRRLSSSASLCVSWTEREDAERRLLCGTYEDKETQWRVRITIEDIEAETQMRWHCELTNLAEKSRCMMAVFPRFAGVGVGEAEQNMMVVNDNAGYIRPLWTPAESDAPYSLWSERGGVYGNGSQMNMQWGCIFDEQTNCAFGFIVEDEQLVNKDIAYIEPTVEVRYFPPRQMGAGEVIQLPPVKVMTLQGDWKPVAEAYHNWITDAFDFERLPDWLKDAEGYVGQWLFRRGQEMSDNFQQRPDLGNWLESFEDLPDIYLKLPVDVIELAFFCRSSMGRSKSGKVFRHTDGDNIIREDLGGAEALRAGIEKIHRWGYRATLYVEGFIVPDDADIVVNGEARKWAFVDRKGTNSSTFTKSGFLHMCPGSPGWQNHLAETCARLIRQTDADGIRLDSLGLRWIPCYSEEHGHDSPYDYNRWMLELLDKVARAVKAVKPDVMLSTEGGVDFYRARFNACLNQQWKKPLVSVTRDAVPVRVALPEYFTICHHPPGPVSASLSGLRGGCGGMYPGGRFSELDEKWRSASHRVKDIIRWGDVSQTNPTASRNDVSTRRFGDNTSEVVVGARWRQREYTESIKPWYRANSEVDIREDSVDFSVTISGLHAKPHEIYLVDVLSGRIAPASYHLEDQMAFVNVAINWFMIIIDYSGLTFSDLGLPTNIHPGGRCQARLRFFGQKHNSSSNVSLSCPSLGWESNFSSSYKTVTLNVPADSPPGKHIVRINGSDFLPDQAIVKVNKA